MTIRTHAMRPTHRRFGTAAIVGAAFLALSPPFALAAEELLVLKLSARDGKFEPQKLEVPAGKRFKIEISNDGKGPMEFESKDLKQEKVLAAGAKSSVVINALKPGHVRLLRRVSPGSPQGPDRREMTRRHRSDAHHG